MSPILSVKMTQQPQFHEGKSINYWKYLASVVTVSFLEMPAMTWLHPFKYAYAISFKMLTNRYFRNYVSNFMFTDLQIQRHFLTSCTVTAIAMHITQPTQNAHIQILKHQQTSNMLFLPNYDIVSVIKKNVLTWCYINVWIQSYINTSQDLIEHWHWSQHWWTSSFKAKAELKLFLRTQIRISFLSAFSPSLLLCKYWLYTFSAKIKNMLPVNKSQFCGHHHAPSQLKFSETNMMTWSHCNNWISFGKYRLSHSARQPFCWQVITINSMPKQNSGKTDIPEN